MRACMYVRTHQGMLVSPLWTSGSGSPQLSLQSQSHTAWSVGKDCRRQAARSRASGHNGPHPWSGGSGGLSESKGEKERRGDWITYKPLRHVYVPRGANQEGSNLYVRKYVSTYIHTYLIHKELCESFGEFTVWTAQDELQHVAMHLLHDNVDLDTRGLGGRDEVGEQVSTTYMHITVTVAPPPMAWLCKSIYKGNHVKHVFLPSQASRTSAPK